MADTPMGFRPVMHRNGAPYNGSCNLYLATSGAAMFPGDAVLITGQSNAAEFQGYPPGSIPIVNAAGTTNTDSISGVVVGVVPTNLQSSGCVPKALARISLGIL